MIPLMDRRNLSIPLVLLLVCVVLNIVSYDWQGTSAWSCAAIWCLLANRAENQYAKDIGNGWERTRRG